MIITLATTTSPLNDSCSSFCVEDLECINQKPVPEQTPLRSRRRVCFNEAFNQEFKNLDRCAEDCHETWYTDDDYDMFKADLNRSIRRAKKRDQRREHAISATFQDIYRLAMIGDDEEDKMSSTQEERLARVYMQNMDLVLGLEFHIVRAIAKASSSRREFLQDSAHEVMRDNDWELHDDSVVEELSETCQSISRPSVLFARFMAQAQQMVAQC